MLLIIGLLLTVSLISLLLLLYWSPGKTDSFLDATGNVLAGSVSEITRVQINDIEQSMIIKGKSDQNPVLLFVHGGPGWSEYVFAKKYDVGLEAHFTVCYWEQRGTGMSFNPSLQRL